MTRRTLIQVGIFVAGLVGGFATAVVGGDSEDGDLDRVAREQCELRKGVKSATAVKQRTTSLPNAPAIPGVTDWIFWVYCEGAAAPEITIHDPNDRADGVCQ